MKCYFALFAGLVLCGTLCAQQVPPRPEFMLHGIVQHNGTSATVIASSPRPLYQAILAVSFEYGWVVDFRGSPVHEQLRLD